MDSTLINRFRDNVNEHDLVYNIYHNYKGKNKWNIICSAMDWITVAVDGINPTSLTFENDNQSSLTFMSFIMCIDVLWEAIQQLHRVIFDTRGIPFKTEKSIFQKNTIAKNDNEYFKTIRACFAAHPVNLKDHFTNPTRKERRYACWSGGGIGPGDFSVILYSNELDKENIFVDIYVDELMKFAEQRYYYLNVLMKELDRQKKEYLDGFRERKIKKVDCVTDQINILIGESIERLNNDYYNYELKKLSIIFNTAIISEKNLAVVDSYRKALIPEVDELFQVLQTMTLGDLESTNKINDAVPDSCHYSFSKLSEAVYGDGYGYTPLVSMSVLKDALRSVVDLDEVETFTELYVVVLAGFFVLNNR